MGTEFRIVLYAVSESDAKKAAAAAFKRVAQLDQIMSDYRADSELMQLCRRAGGAPVKISNDLFFVLTQSQDVSRRTDGAFDVTVGPVVRLWRRARRQHQLPDPKRLARAMDLVGYEKLKLDTQSHTAQLAKPGMLLDLGGIAKGYASDEALAVLKKHGIQSALIAAGGDIVVRAPPPGKEGWTIAIADFGSRIADLPAETRNPKSQIRHFRDSAVSTSGDAEQYVEIGGKRYSHIVNPKTGIGLIGQSSVTVIAPKGIMADSLATAVSVLGPRRGIALIDSIPDTATHFVRRSDKGDEMFESKRWEGEKINRQPNPCPGSPLPRTRR